MMAAGYLNKQLALVIPTKTWLESAFFYYPGGVLYNLIYQRELFKSNYNVGVSGPKLLGKAKLQKTLPECKEIHGMYGSIIHECQMNDSRMNLNTLLTSTIKGYN